MDTNEACVALIVRYNTDIMLVRDNPDKVIWKFPGGKMDPGESESSCLEREIREELDRKLVSIVPLPAYEDVSSKGRLFWVHPFLAQLAGSENGALPSPSSEIRQVAWARYHGANMPLTVVEANPHPPDGLSALNVPLSHAKAQVLDYLVQSDYLILTEPGARAVPPGFRNA